MLKDSNQREFLTAGEAAKFLDIKPDRLRYLRNHGRVKGAMQIGNETFYTLSDLRQADIEIRKRGRKSSDQKRLDNSTDIVHNSSIETS